MSSDSATDSNLGNATTISRNDSESLGPKFSGLTEELRKQLLKKRTKFQELLNTVKALISERGEVRAMCATISDRRLYHTAMNAEIELLVKLKARLVILNFDMEAKG